MHEAGDSPGSDAFQVALRIVQRDAGILAEGMHLTSDELKTLLAAAPLDPQDKSRRILKYAYCAWTTFEGEADFASVTFEGEADFRGATFTHEVQFRNAIFLRRAQFHETAF